MHILILTMASVSFKSKDSDAYVKANVLQKVILSISACTFLKIM